MYKAYLKELTNNITYPVSSLPDSIISSFIDLTLSGGYELIKYVYDKNNTSSPYRGKIAALYEDPSNNRYFGIYDNDIVTEFPGIPWMREYNRSDINKDIRSFDLSGDIFTIGRTNDSTYGYFEIWEQTDINDVDYQAVYGNWIRMLPPKENTYSALSSLPAYYDGYAKYIKLENDKLYVYTSGQDTNYVYDIEDDTYLTPDRIVVTQYANMMESDDKSYIINNYNSEFIYDETDNEVKLGQIHRSDEFLFRNATGNPAVSPMYDTDIEIRFPKNMLNQVIQTDSAVISFIQETSSNIEINSKTIIDPTPSSFTVIDEYKELIPQACIYNQLNNELSGYEYYLETSAPRMILSGIDYGYLNEMVANRIGFDFDNAEVYMDTFNLQNPIGPSYDFEGNIDNGYIYINSTRDYKKLGADDINVWLSYTPNIQYRSIENTYSNVPNNAELGVEVSAYNVLSGVYAYEFIERLRGLNRYGENAHKSNVYSIEINNSNLNNLITDESTKDLIHNIVERAIREFAVKVAPVHTILWKIIWTGN